MSELKRARIPHPLILMTGCIVFATLLSYVLPAGEYERKEDPETGRSVVVADTYQEVASNPVDLFQAIVALPRGMAESADVIFLVFLIGGAFTVVDETGTLRRAITALVRMLGGRDLLVIPIVSLFFGAGGVTQNMQEEIVALTPVLLILTTRVGFTPLIAVAMSAGAAVVGSAFSPINPFQVLIAQSVADLPPASGLGFRTVFLLAAMALWIGITMRHAERTRITPQLVGISTNERMSGRDLLVLAMVAITFVLIVVGLLQWEWGFNELSGTFFIMGAIAGLMSQLGLTGTAEAYVRGFREMAFSALLIGFARAIFVVLDDGQVIDTIVHGMFQPLAGLPPLASALGMVLTQAVIHVPVPSVSSQAVLTMPLLVPLSDLLELPRQITVLAYQYGGGLTDLLTPTNGALMAILAAAGVRYDDWLKFTLPLYLSLVVLGGLAVTVAVSIGLT